MSEFMNMVQAHERQWGTDAYTGRPDLIEIMQSPVVVFWLPVSATPDTTSAAPRDRRATAQVPAVNARQVITLHPDINALQDHLAGLLFRAGVKPPDRRFVAAFQGHKRLRVKAVRIVFETIGDT